jgi:hypothetical protein
MMLPELKSWAGAEGLGIQISWRKLWKAGAETTVEHRSPAMACVIKGGEGPSDEGLWHGLFTDCRKR